LFVHFLLFLFAAALGPRLFYMRLVSGECRRALVLYLCRAWLKRCAGAAAARQTQVTKRFNRGLTITTSATRRSVISLNDSPLRAVMEAATDLQPNLDKAIAEALKGLQHGPRKTSRTASELVR
jgi:hypothetical protein